MLEAPKGFIPTGKSIVNVHDISAVWEVDDEEIDPAWQERFDKEKIKNPHTTMGLYPITRKSGTTHIIIAVDTFRAQLHNCSLIQFIAKMQIALEEIKS